MRAMNGVRVPARDKPGVSTAALERALDVRALLPSSALLGVTCPTGRVEREPIEVDGLTAGLAAAGPALEQRLQQSHRCGERQAGRRAFGCSRSSVRKPWAAVTSAVWWCQPSQERPS